MTAIAAQPARTSFAAEERDSLALAYHRLMLVLLVFAGVTFLIVGRLVLLHLLSDRSGAEVAANPLTPPRADIFDRNGIALARTIDAWSVGIHPGKLLGDPDELAVRLAALMPERSVDDYRRILGSGKTFVYLSRRAAPELVSALNAIGEPAIAFDREPERLYPNLALGAHVLGFTDLDGRGAAGIERALDERLSGPETRDEPLQLSIDARVQQALEAELAEAMGRFDAIGAAGVVMDIRTGEVMAMASLPMLNPNVPGQGSPEARFNRATLGVYELGSTFKPFTVAMAMDAGIIESFGKQYDCSFGLRIGRHTITDTHPFGRSCSVAEIMKESSNIGTAQIAAQLGAERQQAFLRKMGFLDPVAVELKERGHTLTPGSNWGQAATMTVGFGHSIAVTPLHLASGYATLFNGGIWRPATVLKRPEGQRLPEGRRVFTEETSHRMRALLRLVVTHGTGKKANAPGYRVGGKTGTAEKIVGGRYSKTMVVTSFAGVFPMDDPRYAVVTMLDEPKGTSETYGFRTAGWNAAPVFSKVVSRIAPLLGVMPDESRDADLSEVLSYVRKEEE